MQRSSFTIYHLQTVIIHYRLLKWEYLRHKTKISWYDEIPTTFVESCCFDFPGAVWWWWVNLRQEELQVPGWLQQISELQQQGPQSFLQEGKGEILQVSHLLSLQVCLWQKETVENWDFVYRKVKPVKTKPTAVPSIIQKYDKLDHKRRLRELLVPLPRHIAGRSGWGGGGL